MRAVVFFRWRIGALLVSLCLATPAKAEKHALLIGVSTYPNFSQDLQLEGPANDVQLMREVLIANGFHKEHIRVLAEKATNVDGLPTRALIFGELKSIADKAKTDDFVYLLFGGHGTQQPTRLGKLPPEPDGLDELFLPRDAGSWDDKIGHVHNALVDEELGRAINAIRAKGAFVWAVFDSCHSGNVTRGGGESGRIRERKIDPVRSLHIPQKAMLAAVAKAQKELTKTRGGDGPIGAKSGAINSGVDKAGFGGFVYYYAAQSNESTPEKDIPEGHEESKPYGLFTYSLAQVISANPGITYRQAGERILQLYAATNLRSPTPLFEGSGLDAPLFGQAVGDVVRQWKVIPKNGTFEISGGAMHQFGKGAVFAVLPNAAASDGDVVGYVGADKVGMTYSTLVAIPWKGVAALNADDVPRDAVVRLVDPALNLSLRVGLPEEKMSKIVGSVFEKLRKSRSDGLRIEWVAPSQAADIRLALKDGQLWILPSDGFWTKTGDAKTPSIALNKSERELELILAGTLQKVAKVTNLMRIAGNSQSGPIGGKLNMRLSVTRIKTGKKEEISAGTVPRLAAGDKLQLVVRNDNLKAVDITVLAIDSLYGITLLYPLSSTEANRINSGSTLIMPGEGETPIEMDGKTGGLESIVVIAVAEQPFSTMTNLGFLAQEGVVRTRGIKVADTATTIEALFADASDGGQRTRGLKRETAIGSTAIQLFRYRAVPR